MDTNTLIDHMSDDLKAKLAACETAEEAERLVFEEHLELSDDELESLAGGIPWKFAWEKVKEHIKK